MKTKNNKLKKVLFEMFRRAYLISNPPGDFDRLMSEAPINENGEREIPYLNYECSSEDLSKIFKDVCDEYNIKNKLHITKLAWNFYMGPSPKSLDDLDETESTKTDLAKS